MASATVGLKTSIWNNRLKSLLFLALYPLIISPAFIAVCGVLWLWLGSESNGTRLMPEFPVFMHRVIYEYWYVPYIVLALLLIVIYRMHRNQLDIEAGMRGINRTNHGDIYQRFENLCIARGLTTPYLFIRPHQTANAYTTGLTRDTYRVVLSSTLVEKLTPDELDCVMAHELTHILNGDTQFLFLVGTVANCFEHLTSWTNNISDDAISDVSPYLQSPLDISDVFNFGEDDDMPRRRRNFSTPLFGLRIIFKLASLGSLLVFFLVSKKREYMADSGAIELTKNPQAMISALRMIEKQYSEFAADPIRKPLYIHFEDDKSWFSTHPRIIDRVKLIADTNRIEASPLNQAYQYPDINVKKSGKEEW